MTERQKMLIKQIYEEMVNEKKSNNEPEVIHYTGEQVCNICGEKFNILDERANFGLHYKVGFGSKYDLTKIDLNMCCNCFDKVLDYILPQCKIDPLTDVSFWYRNSIVYRGDKR